MNEITSMKITEITLENFRNHTKSEHFEFGDTTFVTGHNGTGKTTMAHAVCYALYGITFYGEQKIERIQNSNADNVKVQIEFIDQNGAKHNFVRSRINDKIAIMYDGYSIQQTMVERLFGDKNSFISMFNPTYLAENMGNDGRELILRHLAPISKEDVLDNLPNFKEILSNIDLETRAPETVLEETRGGIRRIEQQLDVLEGNIATLKDAKSDADQKLEGLYQEKLKIEGQIADFKQRQFEGINVDDFEIQRDVLNQKLKESSAENPEIADIRNKLAEANARVYVSKFANEITKARLEYKNMQDKHSELMGHIKNLKIGNVCPTCKITITERNFSECNNQLMEELRGIVELANGIAARGKELTELDKKAKATFEQFKENDIKSYSARLNELQSTSGNNHSDEIVGQHEKLDYLEKYGNLTEAEYSELNDLQAALVGVKAYIEAAEDSADNSKIVAALEQKDIFEKELIKYKETVNALKEYIFKRAELATKELQMPNVSIKLFEIVRTTGEIKSTFKFEYKGREYSTLSLSEKMLTGIEISAMMRGITGKDYPICIDNTESIAAFNNVAMPSQVIMLRVAKDRPLTVQFQNRVSSQPLANAA